MKNWPSQDKLIACLLLERTCKGNSVQSMSLFRIFVFILICIAAWQQEPRVFYFEDVNINLGVSVPDRAVLFAAKLCLCTRTFL